MRVSHNNTSIKKHIILTNVTRKSFFLLREFTEIIILSEKLLQSNDNIVEFIVLMLLTDD